MLIYNRSNNLYIFLHIVFQPVHENIVQGSGLVVELIFFYIGFLERFCHREHV